MPVFFLSLAGLVIQVKRHRRFLLPLLIVLLLAIYINGSTADWFGGGGFGLRRFTSELAILVIGLAAFLQWLPRSVRLITGGLVAVVLFLHQWILLRIGLPEHLGGQVLSMSPSYAWSESGYPVFIRQIGAHLADLADLPLQWFHWPDTPLGTLFSGRLPVTHVISLAGTVIFLAIVWLLASRFYDRFSHVPSNARWVSLAILGIFLLVADLWILFWA